MLISILLLLDFYLIIKNTLNFMKQIIMIIYLNITLKKHLENIIHIHIHIFNIHIIIQQYIAIDV